MNIDYPKILSGLGEMSTLTRNYDWGTTPVGPVRDWPQSLRTTVGIILSSRMPMFLWWGNDLIQFYNDAYRPSMGDQGKHPMALGQPAEQCWPEIWPTIKPLIDRVVAGEGATYSENQLIPIFRNCQLEDVYWTFGYSPVMDEYEQIRGVLVVCQETTRTISALSPLQLSESRFKSMVEQSPLAIGLLKGPDMIIEAVDVTELVAAQQQIRQSQIQLMSWFEQSPVAVAMISRDKLTFTLANPFFLKMVGRTAQQLIGKPLPEAIPELSGQGFDQILYDVLESGVPYLSSEQPMNIICNKDLQTIYANFAYQPQHDKDGHIIGVFVVANEVTEQVLARIKIEQAQDSLQGAIDLAQLGTFQIDMVTGILQHSDRLRKWFGVAEGETITLDRVYAAICPRDRAALIDAIGRATALGSEGIFDLEYTMDEKVTGAARILHAQARTIFNDKGQATAMIGTARDMTRQRNIQMELEGQVQERTLELKAANQELASGNKELATINEEYIAINEELNVSNRLLARSNAELQQFAYVASHDLQEPLRKIQAFGDLLMNRYGPQLQEGVDYVRRMQNAASRMARLIEDLLSFSKVSASQDTFERVPLNEVVTSVLQVLDFSIQQSQAHIVTSILPVVQGDRLQLEQLFQNLISNALKFQKPSVIPQVRIEFNIVKEHLIPSSIKPGTPHFQFYRINITDNGIGFDPAHAERIFQVFQRLHGLNEYPGTGVGLAICEKVAANHGGAISVSSEPGVGSTFSVFFPL